MPSVASRSLVRRQGRDARKSFMGRHRAQAIAALVSHLRHLEVLASAGQVGVFVADDGEPDLSPLAEWLWSNGVGVALPVLQDDPTDFSMEFVPWQPHDELVPARFGIPVPPTRPTVDLDVVLVSFVGFDSSGNRIGRGGGFFDRFLAATTATIIGVGFEAQRFPTVPVEAHDVALPTIVTELGVRYLSGSNLGQLRGNRPSIGKDG